LTNNIFILINKNANNRYCQNSNSHNESFSTIIFPVIHRKIKVREGIPKVSQFEAKRVFEAN
jgi:hypothetical protein